VVYTAYAVTLALEKPLEEMETLSQDGIIGTSRQDLCSCLYNNYAYPHRYVKVIVDISQTNVSSNSTSLVPMIPSCDKVSI
jgi:hypothetical protein